MMHRDDDLKIVSYIFDNMGGKKLLKRSFISFLMFALSSLCFVCYMFSLFYKKYVLFGDNKTKFLLPSYFLAAIPPQKKKVPPLL